ncbi:MAG: ABC transporter permease [Actinobacteria bacterium]|nr:ABC transporter permease [Actinomycetota bacterium]MBT4009923.1 ABC transporter permease [Actinomycetota bacterium]MBT4656484.1 ABC transporter permease [Actinomycetota bacterium]MBT5704098.1 ABC transporter permease [Actinomycetota bacterium]MBT7131907.1 ABC transporter permease [Actinomycetota bacterium]
MGKMLAARLVRLVATILVVSFVTFMMVNLLPGDPINALVPPESQNDQEFVEQLREEFGLNDPMMVRYANWLGDAVTGDLGKSVITSQPVAGEIWRRLPITAELALVSIGFSLFIAIPLGTLSAYKQGKRVDQSISAAAQVSLSIPNFVLGLLLIYVFAMRLQWLPATGWTRLTESVSGNIKSVLLPAMSLALAEIAVYTRVVRSDMISTLQEDYILSARAKGLKDRFILFRHALRPSSLTLITVVGLNVGALIGGTVVIETLFAIPGLGKRLLDAVFQRDFLMIQGITVFVAVVYVTINTLVDIIYMLVDPRIRKKA